MFNTMELRDEPRRVPTFLSVVSTLWTGGYSTGTEPRRRRSGPDGVGLSRRARPRDNRHRRVDHPSHTVSTDCRRAGGSRSRKRTGVTPRDSGRTRRRDRGRVHEIRRHRPGRLPSERRVVHGTHRPVGRHRSPPARRNRPGSRNRRGAGDRRCVSPLRRRACQPECSCGRGATSRTRGL